MTKAWFKKRLNDHYLKQSRVDSFRSRAAYKLEEIDKKYSLIKPGMKILDLGAAPGSWSQYIARKTGGKSSVIAIDLLPIEPIEQVTILQGDLRSKEKQDEIRKLAPKGLDLVLSDMAPDTTGIHYADADNSIELVTAALNLSYELLKPGGSFVAKVFEGEGYSELLRQTKKNFDFAKSYNPKASLASSRELYLVARFFKPSQKSV